MLDIKSNKERSRSVGQFEVRGNLASSLVEKIKNNWL